MGIAQAAIVIVVVFALWIAWRFGRKLLGAQKQLSPVGRGELRFGRWLGIGSSAPTAASGPALPDDPDWEAAAPSTQQNTAELLKKVRKIEIKSKGLTRHIFAGEYHSAFKGRGMSFSEVRNYQYGDDVRNIDWNVTARTGEPYIKVFEEERELTVMLLVDISRSVFFGTTPQMKNELITEICAVLAFSAINNNDKVGVLFFSDQIEKFIPPKKGKTHILRIIRELVEIKPQGRGTDVAMALQYFNNVVKKRSICFMVSDFLTQGYETPLRVAARRHDLIGIHLYDPLEAELPKAGLIRAIDAETSQMSWIDTNNETVRTRYAQWFAENQAYFRNQFLRSGADTISIRTTDSYVDALHHFFKKRS
ncbi:MAG: DUF58 domain-containing protein [Bacteroidetes bacterium]|nr:MAG: DUF58 domain-containing protein [Bacteroidota bacterium]